MNWLTLGFQSLWELLFPGCCLVCDGPLSEREQYLCVGCNIDIPRTDYHLQTDNPVEKLLWGRLDVKRGTSFFFYNKGSDFNKLLFYLKYKGYCELGEILGRLVAAEIYDSGFFEKVDYIVPIPLHENKKKIRGYNQSECIANGISFITGITLETNNLERVEEKDTQTRKSVLERWENVQGIFKLREPGQFSNKHVLLVDDVLTTGSTLVSCGNSLLESDNITISILTLAIAL